MFFGPRRDHGSMPAMDITDEDIAALTPNEREELIERLARPVSSIIAPSISSRIRRRRLVLIIGSAVLLIPWTIYLGLTLPQKYVSRNWTLTWSASMCCSS